MAWVKKYSDIIITPDNVVGQFTPRNPFKPKVSVRGFFRLVLRNAQLEVITDTGWFPNLVTNYGLQAIMGGNAGIWNYFHIGESATAPAVTDTTLGTWMASGSGSLSNGSVQTASAANSWTCAYQEAKRITGGAGTIREIGISNLSYNGNMIIRTLVAIPLAKAIDQVVDVYHRMECQYDVGVNTGVVNIAGDDYNYRQGIFRLDYTGSSTARANNRPYTGYQNHFYSDCTLRADAEYGAWGFIDDGGGEGGSEPGSYGSIDSTTDYSGSGYWECTSTAPIGLSQCNTIGSVARRGIKGMLLQMNSSEVNKVGNMVSIAKVSDGTGLFKDYKQTAEFYWGTYYGRDGALVP